MNYLGWILAFALTFGAVFLGYTNGAHLSKEDRFYEECVRVLKKRLKSPSSYLLTERTRLSDKPLSLEEAMGWDENPEKEASDRESENGRRLIQAREALIASNGIMRSELIIRYEATNSYGALISGVSSCTTNDLKRDFRFSLHDSFKRVEVDGLSEIDWLYR